MNKKYTVICYHRTNQNKYQLLKVVFIKLFNNLIATPCEGSNLFVSAERKGMEMPPPKVAQKVLEKISQGFYVLRVTQKELYEYDIERSTLTNNLLFLIVGE